MIKTAKEPTVQSGGDSRRSSSRRSLTLARVALQPAARRGRDSRPAACERLRPAPARGQHRRDRHAEEIARTCTTGNRARAATGKHMAKEYKDLVVGLDIGTAKVMVVVAEV